MSRDGIERSGYVVRGRVQGVGFRWWTARRADELGVAGTVRNVPDGTVEVMAVAPGEVLEAFAAALERGPAFARVEAVDAVPYVLDVEPSDFTILRDRDRDA